MNEAKLIMYTIDWDLGGRRATFEPGAGAVSNTWKLIFILTSVIGIVSIRQ